MSKESQFSPELLEAEKEAQEKIKINFESQTSKLFSELENSLNALEQPGITMEIFSQNQNNLNNLKRHIDKFVDFNTDPNNFLENFNTIKKEINFVFDKTEFSEVKKDLLSYLNSKEMIQERKEYIKNIPKFDNIAYKLETEEIDLEKNLIFKHLNELHQKNLIPEAIQYLKQLKTTYKNLSKFREEMMIFYNYLSQKSFFTKKTKEKENILHFRDFLRHVYQDVLPPGDKKDEREDSLDYKPKEKTIASVDTLFDDIDKYYLNNEKLTKKEKIDNLSIFLIKNSDILGKDDVLLIAQDAAENENISSELRDVWRGVLEKIELSFMPDIEDRQNINLNKNTNQPPILNT